MTLRYDQVADLIKIIDASACDELILETADLKLVLRRHGAAAPAEGAPRPAAVPRPPSGEASPTKPPERPAAPPESQGQPASAAGAEVRSPMVGTFYRAPSPDAPPFVEVGTVVAAGQPLCVIEVMKLFTTLFAESAGRIAEIGADNAELVEYGRLLFVIEEAS